MSKWEAEPRGRGWVTKGMAQKGPSPFWSLPFHSASCLPCPEELCPTMCTGVTITRMRLLKSVPK